MGKPTCILVMGMVRSGTSMTAGVLYHLGVDMGPSAKGNRFNQKGYFEDMEFTNFHCERIGTHNMDFLTRGIEQDYMDLSSKGGWPGLYETLIRKRERSELWGLKDPRLFLFMDDFLKLLNSRLKVIKVTRNTEAVVKSLKRYNSNWRIPDDTRLLYIVNQWYKLRDSAIAKTKGKREGYMTITYEQAIQQPERAVEQIADFAGIPVTPAALGFIDPSLDHSKR